MTQQILRYSVLFVVVLTSSSPELRARGQVPTPDNHVIDDVVVLAQEHAVERTLAPKEEHRYRLALKKGECATVAVEQRGIDVVVHLLGLHGEPIADFQDEIRPRGQEHVDVVADEEGDYTLAITPAAGTISSGAYSIRLTDQHRATPDNRSMQEARRLRTSALHLQEQNKLEDARALFEQALAITEKVKGPDDLQVAAVVAQLATVYLGVPDDVKVMTFAERALRIMDRVLGADQPEPALVRARLALAYQHVGQRSRAELLVRQALAVIERTLGEQHLWTVRCLVTLGTLRTDAGDLDEAEAIDWRALAILDSVGENTSVTYAGLLNNLAAVYYEKRDYAQAENLFRRSLAVSEQLRGSESLPVARTLSNLGLIASARRDYASAETYYRRALSIREKLEGDDHPDVAIVLNNIALLQQATGNGRGALETHFRALEIRERQQGGPYRPGTLLSVGNIAMTYLAAGDLANAIKFQRRADAIIEGQLALNLAVGSEKEKLAFVKSISERTDRTISLSLLEAPDDPEAGALAALVILQRKGRVQDAMTDAFGTVRQRVTDPDDRALLDQLKATTTQLARTVLAADGGGRAEERRRTIAEMEARKDRLEAALSDHSMAFRTEMQPVTLAAVQRAMPGDAALVEFAVFRPFDPRIDPKDATSATHYAAFVVHDNGAPRGRDLGPAARIDAAVEHLREALRDPRRADLKARARDVDVLVMQPLRPLFRGSTRLLISPDGALNLVPFEALVDEHGRYLIEQYAMSYLTSGRDLLRMQAPRPSHSGPVIVANPLFGEPHAVNVRHSPRGSAGRAVRESITTADDVATMYFSPLTITADEGRAIKSLFPEATLLTGPRATKAAIEQLDAPTILHIASHGFFLRDSTNGPAAAPQDLAARVADASVKVENPLLRSGLALAGANLTHDPNDGILTAMEASALNLWGTKLVTLSACDTGLGEIRNGEGVYGLRRAFLLAGAETLVMSLWPVSDYMTREMMVPYYAGLRAGLGRGDALRLAKLAMLKRKNREHPFFWAGFIQSGDWGPLGGKR